MSPSSAPSSPPEHSASSSEPSNSKPWLPQIESLNLENIQLPDDPTHPTQIALRTYLLALSLSLGPSLVPVVVSLVKTIASSKKHGLGRLKNTWRILRKVLRRELGYDGFAFAVTLAVWGGSWIGKRWDELSDENDTSKGKNTAIESFSSKLGLSRYNRGFLSYCLTSTVAFYLLQAGRRRSEQLRYNKLRPDPSRAYPLIPYTPPTLTPSSTASLTLDLTLLLVVRALDVAVQGAIRQRCQVDEGKVEDQDRLEKRRKRIATLSTTVDAFAFWACSARIMWCFFYEPQRLPQSYVRWIGALANVDKRLLRTLRHLREGTWSYVTGSKLYPTLLTTYSKDLGYPESWGDPSQLPAIGVDSQATWDILGVKGRHGRGGIPCELVHGGEGRMLGLEASCVANAGIRGGKAFLEALAIYLPAHIVPILITRPSSLLKPRRALAAVLGACRSATFLSTFISSYWFAVCFTRTIALARVFPFISHGFWDGPYGCILAGCLTCGSSIFIENWRRRGEMALYVLPRAIRTCIPDFQSRSVLRLERIAFVLSAAFLLMAGRENSEAMRGMSRWVLSFMMNGPHAGFWQKRQKALATRPGTPAREPVVGNEPRNGDR
ncbi:hypothetical protein PM082_002759 [Marasmius tenuissimus]|nr:hypothetical protein PM082_002759 [Marasmius tenuissimus]